METVEHNPQAEYLLDEPVQQELRPTDTLVLPEGFSDRPFQQQTIAGGDRTKELDVLAEIESDGKTFLLSPDARTHEDGIPRLIVRQIVRREDGTAINVADHRVLYADRQEAIVKSEKGGSILFEPLTEEGKGVTIRNDTPDSISVTVGQDSEPQVDRKYSRKERRGRFYRKAAAVALATTVAIPTSVEAKNTFDSLTHNTNASSVVMHNVEQISIERAEQLSRTMEDLEDGNLDAIRERAETYRQKNAAELPSKTLILKTREAINEAKTHEQVAEALQGFMGFYGKEVGFLTSKRAGEISSNDITIDGFDAKNTSVKDTKRLAQSTVSALDFLPKKLLETAGFKQYLINNSSEYGGARSADAVVVSTESVLGAKATDIANEVTGSQSDEWVILHELGHSFQGEVQYFDDIQFTDERPNQLERGKIAAEHAIKTLLLRSPDAPSGYGAFNGKEKDAEIFAGTLTPNKDDWQGLAEPNDASWFKSKSNAYMMKKLVELDSNSELSTNDASFADWLIANKKGLVEKY